MGITQETIINLVIGVLLVTTILVPTLITASGVDVTAFMTQGTYTALISIVFIVVLFQLIKGRIGKQA